MPINPGQRFLRAAGRVWREKGRPYSTEASIIVFPVSSGILIAVSFQPSDPSNGRDGRWNATVEGDEAGGKPRNDRYQVCESPGTFAFRGDAFNYRRCKNLYTLPARSRWHKKRQRRGSLKFSPRCSAAGLHASASPAPGILDSLALTRRCALSAFLLVGEAIDNGRLKRPSNGREKVPRPGRWSRSL